MKYIKGDQTYSIESCEKGKIRLFDNDDFAEIPWIAKDPNGKDSVLLNHALAFLPHESWGAVIPAKGSFNFTATLEKQELILHPEAWAAYIENKIIDEEGNYIKKHTEDEKAESTDGTGDSRD